MVGLGGSNHELTLIRGALNQLSYRPGVLIINQQQTIRVGTTQSEKSDVDLIFQPGQVESGLIVLGGDPAIGSPTATMIRLHPVMVYTVVTVLRG